MKIKKFNNKLVIFIIFCLVLFLSGCRAEQVVKQDINKVVKVLNLENQVFEKKLNFSGYVKAKESKNFAFLLSGTIEQINISKGQEINKEQILATLDTEDIKRGIESAKENILLAENTAKQVKNAIDKSKIALEAEILNLQNIKNKIEAEEVNLKKIKENYNSNINKIKLSYDNYKQTYEDVKVLYEQGGASKNDFDNAKYAFDTVKEELLNVEQNMQNDINLQNKNIDSQRVNESLQLAKIKSIENEIELANIKLDAANIQYQQAKIALEDYEKKLKDSIIYSNIDGYVLEINAKEGEVVSAGAPIVTVKGKEQVIRIGVPVESYQNIKQGMTVNLKYNEQIFTGIVDTISLYPDEQSLTYSVEIIFENFDIPIGSLVDVEIPIAQNEGVLIPISSFINIDGEDYLYYVDDIKNNIGTIKKINVLKGEIFEDKVLVNNIDHNLSIVYDSVKDLKENQLVMISN